MSMENLGDMIMQAGESWGFLDESSLAILPAFEYTHLKTLTHVAY
jgi:hypothetical protein